VLHDLLGGLPTGTEEKFEAYFRFLAEYGAVHNITAVLDREGVYERHFKDSLALLPFVPRGASVLDVGSGAGFPGVPLKICRPDIKLVALESARKKTDFLRELAGMLDAEYEVVQSRAEDYKAPESFDVAVARAVAPARTLAEYLLPFVRVDGSAVMMKSGDAEIELAEAERAVCLLGGGKIETHRYENSGAIRLIAVIQKIKATPPGYPRGQNKPRLKPL